MTTTAKDAATVGPSAADKATGPDSPLFTQKPAHTDPSPLTVELPSDEPTMQEIRKPYWVGLTKDCPYEYITAGISFEKAVGNKLDERGDPRRIETYGRIVGMTDTELNLAIERLKSKIVRMRGSKPLIVNRKQKGFSGQAGDIPLACFAYIVPGGDNAHSVAARGTTPEALAPIPERGRLHLDRYHDQRSQKRELDTVKGTDAPGVTTFTEDWSDIVKPPQ